MSLSAGSLASPCNSRLSREERRPSTLLSSLNLPTALITYALSPVSLSLFRSLLAALSAERESARASRLASASAAECESARQSFRAEVRSVVLLNYYTLASRIWLPRGRSFAKGTSEVSR